MTELADREAIRQKILNNATARMNKLLGVDDKPEKEANGNSTTERDDLTEPMAKYDPPNFNYSFKSDTRLEEEREICTKWLFFFVGALIRLAVHCFPKMNIAVPFLTLCTGWHLYQIAQDKQSYPKHSFCVDMCLSFGLPLRLTIVLGKVLQLLTNLVEECCFAMSGFILVHLLFTLVSALLPST